MNKVGILGYSRVAKKTMIHALESSKLVDLLMIGSRNKTGNGFGTYEEVLNNKDIDIVYISLPIGLHEEWAIKAANAGKHVLVEKSATTSYESAKKMVDACNKNNVRLMEAFMYRFHPQHKRILEFIDNGYIGDVKSFHGLYGSPFFKPTDTRMNKKLGGGALNDMGCYPINASRMIFNEEPESVSCNLTIDTEIDDTDVKSDVMLNYSNGKNAFCSASFSAYYQTTYKLWTTNTSIEVPRAYAVPEDMETKIYRSIDDNTNERINFAAINQTTNMVDHFYKVINGIKPDENFEKELLAQARVMEAARLSNTERRTVMLEEIK